MLSVWKRRYLWDLNIIITLFYVNIEYGIKHRPQCILWLCFMLYEQLFIHAYAIVFCPIGASPAPCGELQDNLLPLPIAACCIYASSNIALLLQLIPGYRRFNFVQVCLRFMVCGCEFTQHSASTFMNSGPKK